MQRLAPALLTIIALASSSAAQAAAPAARKPATTAAPAAAPAPTSATTPTKPTPTSTSVPPPTSGSAPPSTGGNSPTDDAASGEVTRYTFTGLDIEGELRTPALLQFLARIGGEFETVGIPHRSFMPELSHTALEDAL